jgi:ribosomal protein L35AE/L33A
MTVLRIEHPVPDYDRWKQVFDEDPVDREGSGVRRYRIFRPTDDPNYVMIDLEFDSESEAEALLASLRVIWGRVQGTIMSDPQARIVETIETTEY